MRKLIVGVLIVAVLIMAWFFVDRNVLVVRNFEVYGAFDGGNTDVIRHSGIKPGYRMRKLNVSSAEAGVESTGEYDCVGIEVKYPSTVIINVSVRQPAAVIEAGGFMVTLDDSAYVMAVDRTMPAENFVYVTGVDAHEWELGRQIEADEEKVEALSSVVKAIVINGAQAYVSEVNVSDENAIYAYSRTGVYVLFGDAQNMESKVMWMKYALADLESRGETSGHLDVSSGDKADFSMN